MIILKPTWKIFEKLTMWVFYLLRTIPLKFWGCPFNLGEYYN